MHAAARTTVGIRRASRDRRPGHVLPWVGSVEIRSTARLSPSPELYGWASEPALATLLMVIFFVFVLVFVLAYIIIAMFLIFPANQLGNLVSRIGQFARLQ